MQCSNTVEYLLPFPTGAGEQAGGLLDLDCLPRPGDKLHYRLQTAWTVWYTDEG